MIWIEVRGKRLLTEDAPDACPDGHDQLSPGWGTCPDGCGTMGRIWTCRADGCRRELFDYDHRCPRSGRGDHPIR